MLAAAATMAALVPLLLGLLALIHRADAIKFSVDMYQTECVVEEVENPYDHVEGSYVVSVPEQHGMFGSHHYAQGNLDFRVTTADGRLVVMEHGRQEGKFSFHAPLAGPVTFCFINRGGYGTNDVAFDVRVGHVVTEEIAKTEHLDPLSVYLSGIKDKVASIVYEQRYLRARDVRHRKTSESTNRRVIYYALFEALVLVGVSLVQVMYWRRVFSKRSGGGRV
eukprot:jgi/Chlat1/4288/Chrsp29S04378